MSAVLGGRTGTDAVAIATFWIDRVLIVRVGEHALSRREGRLDACLIVDGGDAGDALARADGFVSTIAKAGSDGFGVWPPTIDLESPAPGVVRARVRIPLYSDGIA